MVNKISVALLALLPVCSLQAAGLEQYKQKNGQAGSWAIDGGRLVNHEFIATLDVNEHFDLGVEAIEKEHWREAIKQFSIVQVSFPHSPYAQDACYYIGVANFFLDEYQHANKAFNDYLQNSQSPKFFEQAIHYKYCIADGYSRGVKRRPFGSKQLPKWFSGHELAVEIFDEVIAAVPSQEIAVKATYSKGWVLWKLKQYHEAIETFQTLVRRYPQDELTPDSYLNIARLYVDQCRHEFQNPDLLSFAKLNLRKFKEAFPREERIVEAEGELMRIKEIYATGLYETGRLYERKESPRASIIYYQNAVHQFPETEIAKRCSERLEALAPGLLATMSEKLDEDQ